MKYLVLLLFVFASLLLVGCSTSEPEPTATPILPTNTPPPTNTPIPTNTSPPPTETPVPEIEVVGDTERGAEIYQIGGSREDYQSGQACVNCHSIDGTDGDGPSLQGISARAEERVPGLSAADYIRQSIMEPREYIVKGYLYMGMINSLQLTEEEVDDLVVFLLTQ